MTRASAVLIVDDEQPLEIGLKLKRESEGSRSIALLDDPREPSAFGLFIEALDPASDDLGLWKKLVTMGDEEIDRRIFDGHDNPDAVGRVLSGEVTGETGILISRRAELPIQVLNDRNDGRVFPGKGPSNSLDLRYCPTVRGTS